MAKKFRELVDKMPQESQDTIHDGTMDILVQEILSRDHDAELNALMAFLEKKQKEVEAHEPEEVPIGVCMWCGEKLFHAPTQRWWINGGYDGSGMCYACVLLLCRTVLKSLKNDPEQD